MVDGVPTDDLSMISGNDIARAYAKQYPGSTLQSVELLSVPAVGGLYYDYYSSGSK